MGLQEKITNAIADRPDLHEKLSAIYTGISDANKSWFNQSPLDTTMAHIRTTLDAITETGTQIETAFPNTASEIRRGLLEKLDSIKSKLEEAKSADSSNRESFGLKLSAAFNFVRDSLPWATQTNADLRKELGMRKLHKLNKTEEALFGDDKDKLQAIYDLTFDIKDIDGLEALLGKVNAKKAIGAVANDANEPAAIDRLQNNLHALQLRQGKNEKKRDYVLNFLNQRLYQLKTDEVHAQVNANAAGIIESLMVVRDNAALAIGAKNNSAELNQLAKNAVAAASDAVTKASKKGKAWSDLVKKITAVKTAAKSAQDKAATIEDTEEKKVISDPDPFVHKAFLDTLEAAYAAIVSMLDAFPAAKSNKVDAARAFHVEGKTSARNAKIFGYCFLLLAVIIAAAVGIPAAMGEDINDLLNDLALPDDVDADADGPSNATAFTMYQAPGADILTEEVAEAAQSTLQFRV